jgi:plastocyanin
MASRLPLIAVAAAALVALADLRLGGAGRAVSAAGGNIRGRVDIRNAIADAEPRPGVAELGMGSAHHAHERRDVVVYIETAPQAAFEGGGAVRASMSQADETFVPHVLAVRVGTIVDFPNNDTTYHNVFSLSKTKRFDLGRYARGQSKSIRFDEPGVVRVFCDIHSHMSAFILVFAHRFFAITDDQGRYRIEQVPPGTYTVAAWYEGAVRQSRSATIPEEGGTVDVDFAVR